MTGLMLYVGKQGGVDCPVRRFSRANSPRHSSFATPFCLTQLQDLKLET